MRWSFLPIAFVLVLPSFTMAQPVVPAFDVLHSASAGEVPRAGLLLLGELGCVQCHKAPDELASWVLPRTAPDLNTVAAGTRIGWIRAFLSEARQQRSDSPMPDLLHGMPEAEKVQAALDLEAFLRQGIEGDTALDTETASAATGRELFHRIGCVACHEPLDGPPLPVSDDPFFDPETFQTPERNIPSVPIAGLADKYRSAAVLAAFLQAPHTWRPAGRMPSFKLDQAEAASLAAYLLHAEDAEAAPEVPEAGDPERGLALFQAQGCAQCHTLADSRGAALPSLLDAPPLLALDLAAPGACIGTSPAPQAAAYGLSTTQVAAIEEAITFLHSAAAPSSADQLRAHLAALNCYACHERDGLGGPEPGRDLYFTFEGVADLGDEGRLPPHLDGVGAKLTEEALHAILHGGNEVRPYMPLRMPDYGPTHGDVLFETILATDAVDLEVDSDTGLEHHHRNLYGRELMGVNALGCVTCHSLNGRDSVGPPGVDLALAPQRLRPQWFKDYLLDPGAYRAQTRMPNFFPEGKSTYTQLFNGDAVKQIEALWTYLKEADVSRLPEGLEPTGAFVLLPEDRPIVHRTFLVDVGTRAIAVGFPEKVHAAYDGQNASLAQVWRGEFLSAESAWANRFTPFVAPLGEDIHALPKGPMVARLDSLNATWPETNATVRFRGYTVNDAGIPTFHQTVAGMDLDETLRAVDDKTLHRALQFHIVMPETWLRLAVSENINTDGDYFVTIEGLRIRTSLGADAARIRQMGTTQELLLALPRTDEPTKLTIVLEW